MRISDWSSDVCSSDLHEAVIAQEIVRAGLWGGFGTGNSVSSGIVAHYILAYGTEAQRHRWLPRMATGELIGAVAMTEPGTGSDLQAVRTTARRTDDGYVINGQKTLISNGQNAGVVVVVAKTDTTRPEEHTPELQSLMRTSYAIF